MKFMKKMAFDFVSPITHTAIVSISPFSVLNRFITLLDAKLNSINNFIDHSKTITPAATKKLAANPVQLIKASTPVIEKSRTHFAGQSVLCVGGQKNLYPAYRQIVEDAGGYFLCFHGRADTSLIELHTLLKDTDMVILPIDCIRHEVFFVTKQFCQRFNKPYVLLDKSRVTTFYNGIRVLKNLQ